jgi:ubiquinone/menaquinone biosynthesis C-methylase UbiE
MIARLHKVLLMDEHVCPWWLAYTFDNRLRRLIHQPERILDGLVQAGQTVVDLGCGMGYFSLAMARMVGENGRVISVDVQEKMLRVLRHRAEREGLYSRIHLHHCAPDSLGINEEVDFALAFWMAHEVPAGERFLREVQTLLKPAAHFLIVEPRLHVSASSFQETLDTACAIGLKLVSKPKVRISRAAILAK